MESDTYIDMNIDIFGNTYINKYVYINKSIVYIYIYIYN